MAAFVPPGKIDLRNLMREVALRRQLLGATHALVSEVAPAQERGRYHLSLRLFKIDSGNLVWADSGDRPEPSLALLGSELASYPYILNTGEVSLLDYGDKSHPRLPRGAAELYGGLPLRLGDDYKPLPMIGKEKTIREHSQSHRKLDKREMGLTWEHGYPPPEGLFTRLGYRERGSPGDQVGIRFRDLFGRSVENVPGDVIKEMDEARKRGTTSGIRPAADFGAIPTAHQMRYLIWTLARGALPVAGRVGGRQDDTYRVNVGVNHRLKPKDRLVVRRPGGGDLPDRILATELIVSHVEEDSVTAVLAPDQASLPGAEPAEFGDIVQRKPTEKVRVAVFQPLIIQDPPPPRTMRRPGLRGAPPPQPRAPYTTPPQIVAQRLAEQVTGGFNAVGVPLLGQRELEQALQVARHGP